MILTRFSVPALLALCAVCITDQSSRADETSALATFKAAGFKPEVKQGAVTGFGFGNPQWTPELWQKLPELNNLTTLIADGRCVDTSSLEVLAKLPKLEKLFINGSVFDDAGFAILARLPNLKSIGFDHNHVFTGSGLSALKGAPNLRSLRLGGCMKFRPEEAAACGELTQLENLNLGHLRLGDETLAGFSSLKNLKELTLDNSFQGTLTGAGLAHLSGLTGLEKLTLGEFVTTYEGGLDRLAPLKGLKILKLTKVAVSSADLAKLQAALPATQITQTPPTDKDLEDYQRRQARLKNGKP